MEILLDSPISVPFKTIAVETVNEAVQIQEEIILPSGQKIMGTVTKIQPVVKDVEREAHLPANVIKLVDWKNEPGLRRLTINYTYGIYNDQWIASSETKSIIFNGKGYTQIGQFSAQTTEEDILNKLMLTLKLSGTVRD